MQHDEGRPPESAGDLAEKLDTALTLEILPAVTFCVPRASPQENFQAFLVVLNKKVLKNTGIEGSKIWICPVATKPNQVVLDID